VLFHLSIEADEPRKVAEFFATIFGGMSAPFPAVTPGSWIALSGDDRGTSIEVYPRGTEIHPVAGDNDAVGVRVAPQYYNATHMAIGTKLSEAEVMALCAAYGWKGKYRKRADAFGVLEIFVEGCQMIEVLTAEMQAEYVASVTIENWMMMLQAQGLSEAA
jgi:hypothetical protein